MEWIFSFFKDWLKDWKTKKGLIGYSLVIIFVFAGLISIIKQLGLAIPPIWSIPIIAISVILYLLFWSWAYIIYPRFISKIKIAFSLEVPGNDPLLDELKKEFYFQIDSLNLKREVRVIDLPSDKRFQTTVEAEKYSKSKHINLLVWGHMKKGQLEGQEVAESRLKFTYIYPTLSKKNIEELLRSDVKLAVVDRNWRIAVRNSIVDIDTVSRNVMEISLFIVGLCLLLWRDTERCVDVFEELHSCLQQGPPLSDKRRVTFLKRFDQIFIEALDLRTMYLFQGGKMQECKKCLERMLEINYAIPGAHINLAKLCYLEGNMGDARYHTNQADRLVPNNQLSLLNKAFFAILDKKFEKANDLYNKLIAPVDWSMSCNTLEVALFLEEEWKKHKDNVGFLFAAGFVNYHFADKRRGKLQLKNFIKRIDKQKVRKEYSPLFITAERTIKRGKP
jgi:hypothetical protein